MFKETLYETADSVPNYHFHFNLAALADLLTHHLITLALTIPLCLLAIYELVIYRPLFVAKSTVLGAMFWLALVALIVTLVAACIQVGIRFFYHMPYNRWKPWTEELAIVTGGSMGLGLLLSKTLAKKGARVAIFDINEPSKDDLAGLPITFFKCDVSDPEQVRKSVELAQKYYDGDCVTILINNAGVVSAKAFEDLGERDILRTFNVNTLAHFWTIKAVLPIMKRLRYGHIVTISSTMGLTAVAGMTDYCASKYAVTGFHEALRQEIRNYPFPHLIHTSMICPGLILTGMFGGIKIRIPFIVPPLKPEHVVSKIMDCLENQVNLPWNERTTKQTLIQCLERYEIPIFDQWKQHKVIWMPTSYYLMPVLNIFLPVWLNDWIKEMAGGNCSISQDFHGRRN